VAEQLVDDPGIGPEGPTQMGRAIDLARRLFETGDWSRSPVPGSSDAEAMHERVSEVTHHLVQGARALMSDDEFDPFVGDWVRYLFDPETLLG
jgi:hypothetical protein